MALTQQIVIINCPWHVADASVHCPRWPGTDWTRGMAPRPPHVDWWTFYTRVNSPPVSQFLGADWSSPSSQDIEIATFCIELKYFYYLPHGSGWEVSRWPAYKVDDDKEHVVGLVWRHVVHGGHRHAHVEAGLREYFLSTAGGHHLTIEAIYHQPRHRVSNSMKILFAGDIA